MRVGGMHYIRFYYWREFNLAIFLQFAKLKSGTVIFQRAPQTTARQYGQRLQVIGVHSTESEAVTDAS